MRIFGILTIGFSVVLLGFCFLNKYIERIKQLNKICYMISIIKQEIIYKKSSVNDILKSIAENKDLSFLSTKEQDLNLIYDSKKLLINNAEKMALKGFFNGLGTTDLKGQINHCDMYTKIFEEFKDKCTVENSSKIKLFPTLFVLLGLLVVILLL